jgi:adenine-specific DNA-methyltransferase
MIENRLNGESLDIVSKNINSLKELFPEIVSENRINFNKLKIILGNTAVGGGSTL